MSSPSSVSGAGRFGSLSRGIWGPDGLARSVVVVATSDQPALVRIKGAMVATTIAEYFRDLGRDVLFVMDSVTRLALAQREVAWPSANRQPLAGIPPPCSR